VNMSSLSDDALLKRANYAFRNLVVLAVLASLLAGGLLFLGFSGKGGPIYELTVLLTGAIVLIASGYWVLAVAARGAHPKSSGAVWRVLVIQIALSLVASGLAASRTKSDFQPNLGGLIIPILVLVALASSRKVLLELQDRGLWERVFAPARPSRHLCVIGGL